MLFNKKKTTRKKQKNDQMVLNDNTPFAIQEAYKTLRTNIMFSLPDEKCKKIVITSAIQHEGKSTTAINLGIAFAKNGEKVILVECDLRLPVISEYINHPYKFGLTNLMYGLGSVSQVIIHHESGLDIITAGDTPPNPSETLGSERMKQLIEALEDHYDYILFDTPPVCTVTDAVVVSRYANGVILVSKKGVSNTDVIDEAIATLKIADAKILGFVFTGAEIAEKNYSKYGYASYGYGSYANKDRTKK